MKITRKQLKQIIKEELRHASQQDLLTESEDILKQLTQSILEALRTGKALEYYNFRQLTDWAGDPKSARPNLGKMHPAQIRKIPATIHAAVQKSVKLGYPPPAHIGAAWYTKELIRQFMHWIEFAAKEASGNIARQAAARGAATTASSAIAAGATAAAVLALFGGVAFATFYPIAQMQKIEGLIKKMAQLNGRPVQLADLDGKAQGRLKEYLATMIIAMNDRENPSEEARESFNEMMASDALPGRKSSSKGIPDIPAHAIIDYKTIESLKPYIRELQVKGKEEAAKMKAKAGPASKDNS